MTARALLAIASSLLALLFSSSLVAQAHDASVANHQPHYYDVEDFGIDPDSVTFADHIAPILQRSCQNCHRPGGGGPMVLMTYEEVRPWAPIIKYRTAIRERMGAMPPYFLEKDIGITEFKDDYSLSDEELAMIQAWADNGAPRGNPDNEPPMLVFGDGNEWSIGEPDLILRSGDFSRPAVGPDWWGDIGLVPTGLTEDRYVSAIKGREINDIPADGDTGTVGGRYIVHHMTYNSGVLSEDGTEVVGDTVSWPIHEVGRNADIFSEKAGRLLPANSALHLEATHMHSNGRETSAYVE